MAFLWLRRIYQATFLALFVFLVIVATPGWIHGYPVDWFLGLDPLAAISVALATGSLAKSMAWALPLIILTLVFGRFFCGWICPMGTLHHMIGWLAVRLRPRARIALNLPRPIYKIKYYILLVMLGAALLGSTQIGLLDPISFTWRAMATVLVPAADNIALGMYQGERHFQFGPLIALLFFGALALNLFVPRLYCRMLCPLGALFGVLAKFSLLRLHKQPKTCTACDVCGSHCQGAADPQGKLRVTECMLCLNCQTGCPRDSIAYRFLPSPDLTTDILDLGRRRWVGAAVAGLACAPILRASAGVRPRPNPTRIRPPGARPEDDFLERCLKCGVCMKTCPTGGLQPAFAEAGFEGLWTPVLVPRIGYCEQGCVLCSTVCPTDAIAPLTVAQKTGQQQLGGGPNRDPVRIGSAFVDRGRCLPWAMDTPCIVCEEVCPVSPKAVFFKEATITKRDGTSVVLKQPHVDLQQCTGCGVCETRCPVFDTAAIRVTSVGETRDPMNRIMLTGGRV